MSDQNPPGENPPPPHNPYGAPDQPPAYGQQPPTYGQPPAYGAPQGYAAPAYGAPVGDPDKRPGTVTAAGIITIVFSGLSLVLFGFFTLGLLVAKDSILDEIRKNPDFQDVNISADSAYGAVVAVIGVFALWSLIALVLGIFVLRRSNGARITLVISSAVTALISLLAITSGITAITLIAAVATIVLLFTGGANPWFKRTTAAATGPVPPPY